MRYSRQAGVKGVSLTAVVIMLVLTTGLVLVAITTNLTVEGLKIQQKKLEAEKKRLNELEERIKQYNTMEKVSQLVGAVKESFPAGDVERISRLKQEMDQLEKFRREKIEKYLPDLLLGADISPEQMRYSIQKTSIEGLLNRLIKLLNAYLVDKAELESLDKNISERLKKITEQQDALKDALKPLATEMEKQETEITATASAEKAKYDDITAYFDNKILKLNQEISELTTSNEQIDYTIRKKKQFYTKKIEILRKPSPVKYELKSGWGKILDIQPEYRTCQIDLGSKDRVRAGMRFLVATLGKRNEYKYVAEIIIKNVHFDWSHALIVDTFDPQRPAQVGDIVVNPLFNPYRPLKIGFVPVKQIVGLKYSLPDAIARIRELGNIILDVNIDTLEPIDPISPDTDMVILMASPVKETRIRQRHEYEAHPNFKTATDLNIPILEAYEVFRFLGD